MLAGAWQQARGRRGLFAGRLGGWYFLFYIGHNACPRYGNPAVSDPGETRGFPAPPRDGSGFIVLWLKHCDQVLDGLRPWQHNQAHRCKRNRLQASKPTPPSQSSHTSGSGTALTVMAALLSK